MLIFGVGSWSSIPENLCYNLCVSFVCQTLRRSECMWHHELSGRSSPAKSVVNKTGETLCQPKQCSNSLKITTKSKINRRFTYKNHQLFKGKWSEPAVNLQGCTLYMFLSFILGNLREKNTNVTKIPSKRLWQTTTKDKSEKQKVNLFHSTWKCGGPNKKRRFLNLGNPSFSGSSRSSRSFLAGVKGMVTRKKRLASRKEEVPSGKLT